MSCKADVKSAEAMVAQRSSPQQWAAGAFAPAGLLGTFLTTAGATMAMDTGAGSLFGSLAPLAPFCFGAAAGVIGVGALAAVGTKLVVNKWRQEERNAVQEMRKQYNQTLENNCQTPCGVLLLASCPEQYHGVDVLQKANKLMDDYQQYRLAGDGQDTFHQKHVKQMGSVRTLWKGAWMGKLEGFLIVFKDDVHIVCIRGGPACDDERDYLTEHEFRSRYPQVKDLTFFENVDALECYLKQHQSLNNLKKR